MSKWMERISRALVLQYKMSRNENKYEEHVNCWKRMITINGLKYKD